MMARLKRLAQPPPRERILQAARELFYRDGLNAVSVDAIAAAAGTNKMTLYRHFSSKDELVAAYLSQLAEEGEGLWDKARSLHPGDADAQLRFMLKRASEFASEGRGRGCALANAAVGLAEVVRAAGYARPQQLADELFLLVEGARVCLQSVGREGPGSRLYALAEG